MVDGTVNFVKKAFDFSNDSFRVIKSSFGPNGLDCMVSTTSGVLLVTNNGFQVLKSLCNRSHHGPVGRLVFGGLKSFYNSTGDFSKKFILLTRELLCEVLDIAQGKQVAPQQEMLAIAQGMEVVLFTILPKLLSELTDLDIVADITEDVESTALSIIRTNLNGKFSPKSCEELTDMLRRVLFDSQTTADLPGLKSRTVMLVDKFHKIFWEVPGRPLSSSAVLCGMVIPRPFVTLLKQLPAMLTETSFKFIVLCVSLGCELPQAKTVLVLKDTQKVKAMLEWKPRFIEGVIQQFVDNGIGLIITSKTLHQTAIHYCNQYRLAAIESVPKDDIQRMCDMFSISPMFELELQNDLSSFIGEAISCKQIGIAQHTYVYLEAVNVGTTGKQVLLCAPSQPMCRQYTVALQNALKSLRNAFREQKTGTPSLSVVSCGGVFELGLVFALDRFRKKNKVESNVQMACCILERALLSVPRQLVENSARDASVCNVLARARESLTSGEKVLGIDKNGALCDLVQYGVFETVVGNYQMVSSVIQLVAQIMRTDQVIHVKALPQNNTPDSDDSENENEDQNYIHHQKMILSKDINPK